MNVLLARADEENVPVRVVLDDDETVTGDGYEGFYLSVGAAVLHHDGPTQGSPQTRIGRKPGPHCHLLLGSKERWNEIKYWWREAEKERRQR